MRKLLLPLTIALAAGVLSGCGDPAPSTTLAPDQKPLDASKLSKEQVDQMLKSDHGVATERTPTSAPQAGGAASQPGGVPTGR